MVEVRMTWEEYQALLDASPGTPTSRIARRTQMTPIPKKKRSGKKDPKMAKALRKANSMMRTKSGALRKGKTQADVMRKAHQLRRKM